MTLDEAESAIASGLGSFCEVGAALARVRAADPPAWDGYCLRRFGRPASEIDPLVDLAVTI